MVILHGTVRVRGEPTWGCKQHTLAGSWGDVHNASEPQKHTEGVGIAGAEGGCWSPSGGWEGHLYGRTACCGRRSLSRLKRASAQVGTPARGVCVQVEWWGPAQCQRCPEQGEEGALLGALRSRMPPKGFSRRLQSSTRYSSSGRAGQGSL